MILALVVEYDGAGFRGWQRQTSGRTVQACVESALSRVANEPVQVICAGRTDSGVHALAQVVHFSTEVERPSHAWVLGANSNLPKDISVIWAGPLAADFHARFAATARQYQYLILNRRSRPGLWSKKVSFVHEALDAEMMHAGAQALLGKHDFTTFRGAGCQARTAVREIRQITVARDGEFVRVTVEANAFLLHMVRNIVGVLLEVGQTKQPPQWVSEALRAKDRRAGGVTAAPDGLYLSGVRYPSRFEIPSLASAVLPPPP